MNDKDYLEWAKQALVKSSVMEFKNNFVKSEEDKMLLPEEIVDTKDLQMYSLKAFMDALGYMWSGDGRVCFDSGCYFESFTRKNRARSTVSFETAVRLYNGYYYDNHDLSKSRSPFDFDAYSWKKAQAAKILKSVKLQLTKKTGAIKASSNIVSFVSPIYYQMFINSKYFPF